MKSLIKKTGTIIGALFLCLSMLLAMPVRVHAWEAHLDEENNIQIYTHDKIRKTPRYYRTVGVSITRCAYDPTSRDIHESQLYFEYVLKKAAEKEENGVFYNTWTITLDEIIKGAADKDPEWAKEIQNAVSGDGPAVYIKLDCIMIAIDESLLKVFGPFRNVPGYGQSDGNRVVGVDKNGYGMEAYGFDIDNGLITHFNHYLLIGNGEDKEPEPLPDELVTYDYTMDHYAGIDANQPAFAMSNDSDLFDLSKGIPSSEYINNTYLADTWYGNTNVYARMVGKEYSFNITYRYKIDYGSNVWTDLNQNGQVDEGEEVWDANPVTYAVPKELNIGTAYVAFQYLADTHIYDFTNVDIENGAYFNEHINYDDTNEVPMTCISTKDYVDVAAHGMLMTEEPDWLANTDDHVKLAKSSDIDYPHIRNLGTFLPAEAPDLTEESYKDIKAIQTQISNHTQSRNDKLVIDGITFMRNDWITGCDFLEGKPSTYKDCKASSAWKEDYCLQAGRRPLHEIDPSDVVGSVSVQIPSNVDNGYYSTKMKVYYQRLVTYSKTTPGPFEAD